MQASVHVQESEDAVQGSCIAKYPLRQLFIVDLPYVHEMQNLRAENKLLTVKNVSKKH
jgi:hypothetical protein